MPTGDHQTGNMPRVRVGVAHLFICSQQQLRVFPSSERLGILQVCGKACVWSGVGRRGGG